ncbi:MAG: hypothetical protein AB9903_16975 [Vulcanimicrobiota bacterium]
MDLNKTVMLKSSPMPFDVYCRTYEHEQHSSIDYLSSSEVKWNVPLSLCSKVDDRGALLPYFGDTVTIPIASKDIAFLSELQSKLYRNLGDILAEPLQSKHFHITLHDLTSGASKNDLKIEMEKNKAQSRDILRETASYLSLNPELHKMKIKATRVFPCCNISLILALLPEKEHDYRFLMNLYNSFDEVVCLDYWLRLHVTLAYFKPVELSQEQIGRMLATLSEMDEFGYSISLDILKTAYQQFSSMNNYRTQISVSDFRW